MRGKIDNTEYYLNLGKKILKIREEKKITQKEISHKIGVTFQQWQKYEKGTNRIPTKALVTFCELTNSDIKELTGCRVNNAEEIYIKRENLNNFIIKVMVND